MKKLAIFLFEILFVAILVAVVFLLIQGKKPVYSVALPEGAIKYTFVNVTSKTNSECMSSIDGKVYDFSSWIKRHPGGSIPIKLFACQKDATLIFGLVHSDSEKAHAALAEFHRGYLVE